MPPAAVMKLQVNDTGKHYGMQWNCQDMAVGQGKGRMKIKVKFVSAEKEGWDYIKGTCTIDVKPTIKLSELSEIIQGEYGIPDGRSHIFYMNNTERPPIENQYSDLDEEYLKKSDEYTIAQALITDKFKYVYSQSDELLFQCTVL